MDIGIIGLGRMGQTHLQNLIRALSVPAQFHLFDTDWSRDREETVRRNFQPNGRGIVKAWFYRELSEIFSIPLDALLITTPTVARYAVLVRVLDFLAETEKPPYLFCEKPLCQTAPEAETIYERFVDYGIECQVGFMRRFDPLYQWLAKARMDIGTLTQFKTVSRDPGLPALDLIKFSGGIIHDLAIHDIDLARWLCGEVRSVYTIGSRVVYPELAEFDDYDNAIITLNFVNGAIGALEVSRNALYGYDIRAEILGSEGMVSIPLSLSGNIAHTKTHGVTQYIPQTFFERFEVAFQEEMRAFLYAVTAQISPVVTALDGVKALKIADAAALSLQRNTPEVILL